MDPNTGSVVDSTDWPVPYSLGLTWDGSCWWSVSSNISAGGNERVYKLCNWPSVEEDKSLLGIRNYPTPVIYGTYIEYNLPETGSLVHVILKLYDITGRDRRTLIAETQNPGTHRVYWDCTDNNGKRMAPGIYFYCIEAGKFRATKKTCSHQVA